MSISSPFRLRLLALPLLIGLAACGDKAAEEGAAAGNSVSVSSIAAVAPPAGTKWSETVAETPEGGFLMGNPQAPIKIVEFASYTCSHCKDFSEASAVELKGSYVESGKVSFELRPFIRDPLDMTVALIARCGGKDVFFGLSEQAFSNQTAMITTIQSVGEAQYSAAISAPPTERFVKLAEIAGLIEWAQQRGIPADKAKACLADTKTAEMIANQTKASTESFNIEGTPTILMNGQKLDNVSSWPTLKERLNGATG